MKLIYYVFAEILRQVYVITNKFAISTHTESGIGDISLFY